MNPYYIIVRSYLRGGQTVRKFLRRPQLGGTRWSWTTKQPYAARFQDLDQATAYANSYAGAEPARMSDGI